MSLTVRLSLEGEPLGHCTGAGRKLLRVLHSWAGIGRSVFFIGANMSDISEMEGQSGIVTQAKEVS